MSKTLFLKFPTLTLLITGAVSALSLAPVYWMWVLFFTIPLALYVFENAPEQTWQKHAWRGFCFGFGYFIAALHWIGFAFLVNPAQDLWMMPFAIAGLASILALFWACAASSAFWIQSKGFALWLSFPLCFAIFEWVRGQVFTGFPWAVFGQAAVGHESLSQLASLVGMNGLTLLIWLWAAAPFAAFKKDAFQKSVGIAVLASLPLTMAFGGWRLAQNSTTYVPNVIVRLVQPNISQSDKWRNGNARAIFNQLLAMTSQNSETGKPITHIVWPESSIPFLIDESAEGRAELRQHLQTGQTLIAGGIRRDGQTETANYFTSILLFNDQGEVINHYDKSHLVPGGEYLPLAWLLEPLGLRKLVTLPESFTSGQGANNISVPGAGLASFSICYEAIFPRSFGTYRSKDRATWLVNVTNDGWFGNSAGPHQHLAQMRLRAIENGLPAARSANTGISAMIDPFGRLNFAGPLNVAGNFDLPLPAPLSPTLYSRIGDFALLLLLGCVYLLAAVTRRKLT